MPFTAEDQTFREEVRSFLRDNLPQDIREKVLAGMEVGKDDYMRWHRILYKQGWVAPTWPKDYGGAGWNAKQKYIWDEETGLAGAPRLSPFGLTMIGPVLMAFGTEEQKKHLPKILSGEELWCQGYSEPGSGSDLASLKTRAERRGDHYLINGQKIWTSLAHHADWIFCLVRTSQEAKKQDGISFMIFPMTTPGIEVRPLITINGLRHVNEVFLTDVKVPLDALVGEEGKGWTIAKYLLEHERTHTGSVGELKTQLRRVRDIAAREPDGFGRPLIEDEDFRRQLAQAEIDLLSVEQTSLRALAAFSADRKAGTVSSLLKIRRTELQQRITELGVQAAGYYAMPFDLGALKEGWNEEPIGAEYFNGLTPNYYFFRAASIYSGSNEIQRNIIAKQELRL